MTKSTKQLDRGQGYHLRGKRAAMIARRLKALRDPAAARALMDGKVPEKYPDGALVTNKGRE